MIARDLSLVPESKSRVSFIVERISVLCALIRLADELDIAADRNVFAKYDEHWTRDYDKHGSIKHMDLHDDCFELTVETIMKEEESIKYMYEEIEKLQKTLTYCVDVVAQLHIATISINLFSLF